MASCPLQAEAQALKEAMKQISLEGINSCVFYTDCRILGISTEQLAPPLEAEWRAFTEIFDVWKSFKQNEGFKCVHVGREQNGVADSLAKLGRKEGWDITGHTYISHVLKLV